MLGAPSAWTDSLLLEDQICRVPSRPVPSLEILPLGFRDAALLLILALGSLGYLWLCARDFLLNELEGSWYAFVPFHNWRVCLLCSPPLGGVFVTGSTTLLHCVSPFIGTREYIASQGQHDNDVDMLCAEF